MFLFHRIFLLKQPSHVYPFFVIMFNTLFVLSMWVGELCSMLANILHGFLLQVASVALVIYVRPYVAHWTKKGRITRRSDSNIKAEIKRDAVFYVVSVLFSLLWGSETFLNSPALVSVILNFAAAASLTGPETLPDRTLTTLPATACTPAHRAAWRAPNSSPDHSPTDTGSTLRACAETLTFR